MEFILFAGVGSLAIIAAVAMLLSENAVYSALFLIVNFICVAFLYLMLEAPFLAMVQIAVYAGAIMVLFLFVIMLLGADRPTEEQEQQKRFPWLPALATGLALSFVFSVGAAIASGEVDTREPAPAPALVQFVHAVPLPVDPPGSDMTGARRAIAERRFDVRVDGELVAEDLTFTTGSVRDTRLPLEPGDYTVTLSPAGTDVPLLTSTLTVGAGEVVTAIIHGASEATLALDAVRVVPQETDQNTQLIVFNANPTAPSIGLVEIESELFDDSRKVFVVVDDVAYGTASEPVIFNAARFPNRVIIEAGRAQAVRDGNRNPYLLQLRDLEQNNLPRGTSNLLIFTGQRGPDGGLRPAVIAVENPIPPRFGSPAAVGYELFGVYMLPMQLVALLLLAAMVGVIVLTLRGEHVPKPSRSLRRKVSRPLTSVITSQTGADLGGGSAPRLGAPSTRSNEAEPAGD